MYKIIGHPGSRTIRVLWALEEMGLDWTLVPAKPQSGEARSYNPAGKVPALVVGDTVITDSVAILTYLADANHRLTFPAGSLERARQDSFTQFACDEFDQPLWTAAKHRFALPEHLRVPAVKETARVEWDRACGGLADRIGAAPFVMGDEMSVPDIVIGHCAGWAKNAGFDWPGSAVGDYFARMQGREALARAREKGAAHLEPEGRQ